MMLPRPLIVALLWVAPAAALAGGSSPPYQAPNQYQQYMGGVVTQRYPSGCDDSRFGYRAGDTWLAPDGLVYVAQQVTAPCLASWGPRYTSATVAYDLQNHAFPCDLYPSGTKFCGGTATMRSSYAGHLMSVMRASDGTSLDVDAAGDGYLDEAALLKFCATTICVVTKWWDQGVDSNGSPTNNHLLGTAFWVATSASNAAAAKLNFASTTGIVEGRIAYADFPNCADTFVIPGSITATQVGLWTVDGAQPCAAPGSGSGVIFTTAPTISQLGRTGRMLSIASSQPTDPRQNNNTPTHQYLSIPAISGLTSDNHSVMMTGRVQAGMSTQLFSLYNASAAGNGLGWSNENGGCVIQHQTGSGAWSASFQTANAWGFPSISPFVAGEIAISAVGHAFVNDNSCTGSTYITGTGTLGASAGGKLGMADVSGVSGPFSGSVEFSQFILAAGIDAPTEARVKAAMVGRTRSYPQVRDNLVVGYSDVGFGASTTNLQDWPRQVADMNPGLRVTNMSPAVPPAVGGGSAALVCNYVFNFPNFVANQVNPLARNNVAVFTPTPNGWNTSKGINGSLTGSLSGGSLASIVVSAAGASYGAGTVAEYVAEVSDGSAVTPAIGFYVVGSDGTVQSVSISLPGSQGGTGYPASATHSLDFIWGGGSGAAGTYTVSSGGVVTSVALTAAGGGYVPGTYRLVFSGTAGTPARAAYTTAVNGTLASARVVRAGSSYAVTPRVGGTVPSGFVGVSFDDPQVEQNCNASAWALAKAAGFNVVVAELHPVSASLAQIQGNFTYYQAVNTWIAANAPSLGVVAIPVWTNPAYPSNYSSDQRITQSGNDFTAYGYQAEGAQIMDAIRPLLRTGAP